MASPTSTPITLTEDEVDDLIYFARTAELPSLTSTLSTLSTTHASPSSSILSSAIDPSSSNTLLHYPAANGSLPIISYLVSLLPPAPASSPTALASEILNKKNENGNTALHWAALNGHLEVVKALVGAGADPGVLNGAGRDAIVEAEMSGKEGAMGCAVWMLEVWAGAERGVGGAEEEVDGG
jgi:uncharacterized protein